MTAPSLDRSPEESAQADAFEPLRVSILVFTRALGASIYSAFDDLSTLGQRPDIDRSNLRDQRKLTVRLVAVDTRPVALEGGAMALPQAAIADVGPQDIVFIPACFFDFASLSETAPGQLFDTSLLGWVADQYAGGATIAGLCTGCFVMAEAGLLSGHSATVYSKSADMFARRYRDVDLQSDRPLLVTGPQGRLVMGGDGIYHSDLILYLIQRFVSREAMHAMLPVTGSRSRSGHAGGPEAAHRSA